MRYLSLLILMAALLSFRPAHAATATTRIAPDVPVEVAAQWQKLAAQYPAVAGRIARIEVRYKVRWSVSYQQREIYLNGDKGSYALNFVMTREFAYRAYDYVRLWRPADVRGVTRYQFAARMLRTVR